LRCVLFLTMFGWLVVSYVVLLFSIVLLRRLEIGRTKYYVCICVCKFKCKPIQSMCVRRLDGRDMFLTISLLVVVHYLWKMSHHIWFLLNTNLVSLKIRIAKGTNQHCSVIMFCAVSRSSQSWTLKSDQTIVIYLV
jgi:hypothetical protein